MQIPAFVKRGNKTILTVDGVPFTAIAGEVHNSDYSSLAVCMGQTLLQAKTLKGEDLVGSHILFCGFSRDKRHPVDSAGECGLSHLDIKTDIAVFLVIGCDEGVAEPSLMLKMLKVNLSDQKLICLHP